MGVKQVIYGILIFLPYQKVEKRLKFLNPFWLTICDQQHQSFFFADDAQHLSYFRVVAMTLCLLKKAERSVYCVVQIHYFFFFSKKSKSCFDRGLYRTRINHFIVVDVQVVSLLAVAFLCSRVLLLCVIGTETSHI